MHERDDQTVHEPMSTAPLLPTSASASASTSTPPPRRHAGLDLFRGVIVVVMALDHTTHAFVSAKDRYEGSEAWQGEFSTYNDSWRVFVERAVSHLCAPGFFFTMGVGMTLFSLSRTEKLGWGPARVFKHFAVRGAVLCCTQPFVGLAFALPVLVDIGVHNREWTQPVTYEHGDEGKVVRHSLAQWIQITTTLGLTMWFFCWVFFPLHGAESKRRVESVVPPGFLALGVSVLVFALFQAISNVVVVHAQHGHPTETSSEFPGELSVARSLGHLVQRMLFFPGLVFQNWVLWDYPLLSWASMCVLGMGFGFVMKKNSDAVMHLTLRVAGLMFLVLFVVIRQWGGPVGNFRGKSRGDHFARDEIMFFAVTKYPPDLAFALLTLGVDFLLISLLSHSVFEDVEEEVDREENRLAQRTVKDWIRVGVRAVARHFKRVLLVFGRVPFFFYVLHVWVINVFEALLRLPDPPSGKFRLEVVLVAWLCVVATMVPLCVRFHRFKEGTGPESWWRVF